MFQTYYGLCDIATKMSWKKKETCRNQELWILNGLQIQSEITTQIFCFTQQHTKHSIINTACAAKILLMYLCVYYWNHI